MALVLPPTVSRCTALLVVSALVSACDGPSGAGEGSGTAKTGIGSAALSALPRPDVTPPSFWPPGYKEISWSEAVRLIRNRKANRAVWTQTRRAYVVTWEGEKYFTIEPRYGDMSALLAEVDPRRRAFLHWGVEEISWQEAEEHIRKKQVHQISEGHFRMVTLGLLAGGRVMAITPPNIDVMALLREVDPTEKNIGYTIE